LEHSYKKFNFPFTALRLYQAYGPKQDVNRLIPYIIKSCLQNKEFPCTSGTQLRDFLYIDDMIDLIFNIFNNEKSRGQIFNVGSGKKMSVKKLILSIVKITKKGRPGFNKIKMRKDENNKMYPDISKVKRLLKWYPKTNLEKGLIKTVNFYKK
jgi:nucleoside-diphosphate-sugar epimerase